MGAFKRLRRRIAGIALGAVAWAFYLSLHLLPNTPRYRFLLSAAKLVYIFWGGARTRLRTNLVLVRPDYEPQVGRRAAEFREVMARTWSFLLGRGNLDPEELRGRIDGAQPLIDRYKAGEKLVITTPHVGPVNELAPAVAALGVRAFVPTEAVPSLLFGLTARLRERSGGVGFEPIRRGEALRRCAQELDRGRGRADENIVVILAVDMDREDGRGVLCRIGGACSYFPVGAVKLALEQGAAIIPVFPYYDEAWVPRLRIGEAFELHTSGDSNADIELNTRRLIEEVYAPFIEDHCAAWWRHIWAKLQPAPRGQEGVGAG